MLFSKRDRRLSWKVFPVPASVLTFYTFSPRTRPSPSSFSPFPSVKNSEKSFTPCDVGHSGAPRHHPPSIIPFRLRPTQSSDTPSSIPPPAPSIPAPRGQTAFPRWHTGPRLPSRPLTASSHPPHPLQDEEAFLGSPLPPFAPSQTPQATVPYL